MRHITHPLGTFDTYSDMVGATLATGAFWDEQIRPLLDRADPAGMALDLGAHIGWFTVYLARRHPHVVALEAHPQTYALLEGNCLQNGVRNVTLVQAAAYDRAITLHLVPEGYIGWAIPSDTDLASCPHPASIAFTREGTRLEVQGIPVDSLLAPDAPVSVIKVDVQGCDLRALKGLRRTLDRHRPLVVFEFEGNASEWHGDFFPDYVEFFAAHHYRVSRIREDLWDYTAIPEEVTA